MSVPGPSSEFPSQAGNLLGETFIACYISIQVKSGTENWLPVPDSLVMEIGNWQ